MPKIYQISDNTYMMRFYYEPTMKAAKAKIKEIMNDRDEDSEYESPQIDSFEFPATKEGLAEAMNFVIDMTGHNEG